MAKAKVAFFCQSCGYESPKWTGQCPSCSHWNTMVEELVSVQAQSNTKVWKGADEKNVAKVLDEVAANEQERLQSPDAELNRVWGGGLVPGSITLLSGEPGIGKSTLLLQCALAWKKIKCLYISGEESAHQIKMRADRTGMANPQLYLLTATDMNTIFNEVKKIQPQWIIIDSIQTLESPHIASPAGSVSQVRECTAELIQYAKHTGVPICIIGHITKDGSIAGPKVLEHMVDTVLQFEGDRHYSYRMLRTLKNRFGASSELGIYEMVAKGMRPVSNPSELLISQHEEDLGGIAITATLEGVRPLLMEVQALVTASVYGTPQRTVSGMDPRRVQLILAVLEKRGGLPFGTKDVFVNIAGGLKVEDPAIELALVCALISSLEDRPLSKKTCFVGEIGLSGEVRAVSRVEQRLAEIHKLGFEKVYIPKANAKAISKTKYDVEIIPVLKVEEIYRLLF